MNTKIRKFINACKICAKYKYDRRPYNIKISPRPITQKPFERVHMDIFGMDKHYFLSLVCSFSKHLQLVKIDSRNTIDIQSGLTHYISTFEILKKIVCDHECSFRSLQLRGFLDNLGIELESTLPK